MHKISIPVFFAYLTSETRIAVSHFMNFCYIRISHSQSTTEPSLYPSHCAGAHSSMENYHCC